VDYIRVLFGEFGVWLLGIVGILLAALLGWVTRQFASLTPTLHSLRVGEAENKDAITFLKKTYEEHKNDLKDHKSHVFSELENLMDTIKNIDDLTRRRLDGLNSRLDGIVDQNSSNYQSLAEQLTTMQQTIIAKQEAIITNYAKAGH